MNTCVSQRLFKCAYVTHAVGTRISGMVGLATVPVAGDLGVDTRPAPQRVRELLKHQEGCAFPQQKSIARPVERPHGPGRAAVMFRHGPQSAKARMDQLKN